jgi:CHAT domain-containing protein
VFANACHSAATGDTRMQELDTAARATRNVVSGVLGAGARAFIGAQWEVDDKAAATFARAVYRELLVREPSPRGTTGEAVRAGRAAVVAKHGAGEPAWAAYALYGSPWQAAW